MIGLLVCFTAACGQQGEKNLEELEQEVMAIHDEVMPKMGLISALNDSLKSMYTHYKIDSVPVDSTLLQTIDNHIKALSSADESMMQWMRNYEKPGPNMTEAQKRTYFEKEKSKITDVRDTMLKAIANAQDFIATLNKEK